MRLPARIVSRPPHLVGPAAVLALVLALALLGAAPSAQAGPPPAPAGAAPAVTPATRIAGEPVRVAGTVPGSVARPVVLQGRVGGAWKRLAAKRSTRSGRVIFTTTSAASAVRLVAPRSLPKASPRYPAFVSPARPVGLQVQKVSLTLPATAVVGSTAQATVRVTPFRKGRTIRLQGLVGAVWTDMGPSDPGITPLTVIVWGVVADVTQYRALATGFHGASLVTSGAKTLPLLPPSGIVKVSQAGAGGESNSESILPSVSGDGRYVAFQSGATDLGAADPSGRTDVYLRDQQTGAATRVTTSITSDPTAASGVFPAISSDGAWVTFFSEDALVASDTNLTWDVYLWSRLTGLTTLVSHAPGGGAGDFASRYPTISADGNLVAYETNASDIVPRGDVPQSNVVIWNRTTGTSTLVSDAPGADFANGFSNRPALAADGSAVAYESSATNLLAASTGTSGRYDVYRQALSGGLPSGSPQLVSHVPADAGTPGNGASEEPSISGDGRFVAYQSAATDLAGTDQNLGRDVFVWDVSAPATTTRVTNPPTDFSECSNPAFSQDGTTVVLESNSPDFVSPPGVFRHEIFRWRRATGVIDLVSRPNGGGQADGDSFNPSVSAQGDEVVFESAAKNLVGLDVQPYRDVFLFHG